MFISKLVLSSRRFVLVLLIASFGLLGTIISPFMTALAVTCSGYSCDGKSPIDTGCSSDAVTILSKAIYDEIGGWGGKIATVQLRYSPTCKTVWSRTVTATGPAFLDFLIFDIEPQTIKRTDNLPPSQAASLDEYDSGLSDGQSAWGMQLYLPNSGTDGLAAKVCANIGLREKPGDPDFNGGGYDCSSSWNGVY